MHRPYAPTTTNVSDLLNAMSSCVEKYPDWADDNDLIHRMMAGYNILTKMSNPEHLTEDEFTFVMEIFNTCKQRILP